MINTPNYRVMKQKLVLWKMKEEKLKKKKKMLNALRKTADKREGNRKVPRRKRPGVGPVISPGVRGQLGTKTEACDQQPNKHVVLRSGRGGVHRASIKLHLVRG